MALIYSKSCEEGRDSAFDGQINHVSSKLAL